MTMAVFRNFRAFEPWTWFASIGFFAFLKQFIPHEYTDSLRRSLRLWLQSFFPYILCDVKEYDNSNVNTLYPDVEIYLSSLTAQAAQRLSLSKPKNAKSMTFTMANEQRTYDQFDNAKVEWVHRVYERNRPMWANSFESHSDEKRYFTLQIGRKDKDRVLDRYMAHIQARAKELKRAARDLLLYTNSKGRESYYSRNRPWESVNFVHPASFDTLALDGDLKTRICEDLEKFAQNKEYYQRVGKAWKRGYLLYGPPGTGKSSMIAAIANKMGYDVYDLELTEVESNIELRKLLLHTSNKSVIVIEDIDCSLDLSGQRKKKKKKAAEPATPANPSAAKPGQKEQSKVTLSGLLNFVDGLWSCCGSERIFIFTTNYVEKLDPALLRAGRMDMHINLSYCTFSAFQGLAKNYLQVTEHELFDELESSFQGSYMTPAEVGEVLIKNQDYPTAALEQLLLALDEHRVKPQPPPPDSDDEKEDEKDVVEAAGKEDKEAKTTTTTTDEDVKSTKTKKTEEEPKPADAKSGEKQTSLVEKIHPIDEPVEIKEEVKKTNDSENGLPEAAAIPAVHANGRVGGLKDSAVKENTVLTFSNGEIISSSAGKKDVTANGVADAPHSSDVPVTSSNGKVATKGSGDVAASDGSAGKGVKENGVVGKGELSATAVN